MVAKRRKKRKKGKKKVITMSEDKEFPRLESHEWYKARLDDVVFKDGRYGEIVLLNFEILSGETEEGGDANGLKTSFLSSADLSPSSKLYPVVQVFEGGREIDMDEQIDLEAYIGKKVEAFVQDSEPKKGSDEIYQNVTKIRNLKRKKKRRKKKRRKKKRRKK